jgi:hypothetical protein
MRHSAHSRFPSARYWQSAGGLTLPVHAAAPWQLVLPPMLQARGAVCEPLAQEIDCEQSELTVNEPEEV